MAFPIATGVLSTLLFTTSSKSGIRTEKFTGFRSEHRIPALAAAPVVAMEEKAVMGITTTLGWEFFRRRQSSKPSMPGIL
jgi:hypothetical protein